MSAEEPLKEVEYPKLYSNLQKRSIEVHELVNQFKDYDVLILGEEHNDEKGHQEKLKLIKLLSGIYEIGISMEMFERDNQIVLDEYLLGIISESQFISDVRVWQNYKKDYRPILEFAKENHIPVIASNAPLRYVRLISKSGMDFWKQLPDTSFINLPPISSITAHRSIEYEDKVAAAMGEHSLNSNDETRKRNFLLAQHLRDASMSHFISESHYRLNKKIVHINGRFHSDNGLGVTFRLKSSGLKVLTVSMFPEDEKNKLEDNSGDVIYLTGKRQ
ncbi:MAG: ChaN family lipoprotein [Leptospiraceae bacterium]|nr:ChaN family lipoprotein [Leptospiraceae bacterium]